ncbi:MAG TPA: phage tail sheath family protein [Methylothermaceae bacterium]|nr:phage tail sheath family protein [Methylothermaceae bacterium]
MAVSPTYPGVYIEEVPGGVRTITGVSTSVTAFVGYTRRGPLNHPVRLFNFGDFERTFGGLDPDSALSYAVYLYFLNGGSQAWVVRTAKGAAKATVTLKDESGSNDVLTIEAASAGEWANNLRIEVDYDTTNPDSLFNLTVTELLPDVQIRQQEEFRNLSMDPTSTRNVVAVVNEGSKLIRVRPEGAGTIRPAQTGTTSGDLADLSPGDVSGKSMDITVNGKSANISFSDTDTEEPPSSLPELRSTLQAKIEALTDPILKSVQVQLIGTRLRFVLGPEHEDKTITFSDVGGGEDEKLASTLKLDSATVRTQLYPLENGNDGSPPSADELKGKRAEKTGLYALEDVDIFNILCLPGAADLEATQANATYSEALNYCEERRAFLIVDLPGTVNTLPQVQTWLNDNGSLKHRNAAIYFPRIRIPDPLQEYRPRPVPPSGAIAGLYARTDSARGVWKAPAGIDASLRGVVALDYKLSDQETGVLNPLGVNCLRAMPVYGPVTWGARTLKGDDRFASEWKYIPVRRLALFLEESLYRGTQWVVFEPNDEPLWSQIRLNVGAFMQSLFRQGAFQGTTPRQAYFVKCDKETTTQDDINRGIVNILVGFAPLKPAEFVIIRISQIAGQTAA